jgi:hypothetical protein
MNRHKRRIVGRKTKEERRVEGGDSGRHRGRETKGDRMRETE